MVTKRLFVYMTIIVSLFTARFKSVYLATFSPSGELQDHGDRSEDNNFYIAGSNRFRPSGGDASLLNPSSLITELPQQSTSVCYLHGWRRLSCNLQSGVFVFADDCLS